MMGPENNPESTIRQGCSVMALLSGVPGFGFRVPGQTSCALLGLILPYPQRKLTLKALPSGKLSDDLHIP